MSNFLDLVTGDWFKGIKLCIDCIFLCISFFAFVKLCAARNSLREVENNTSFMVMRMKLDLEQRMAIIENRLKMDIENRLGKEL